MSKNSVNLSLSTTLSIKNNNVEECNCNSLSLRQQCITCETFGIVNSMMEMLPLNSTKKEQNNQYICINKSFYSEHLAKNCNNELKKPQGIKMERSLQQVDIQVFLDLILEIYIPLTLVYILTNYVGISCKIYEDSQFNKL